MNILQCYKSIRKRIRYHKEMIFEFIYDYCNYSKYNYNGKCSTSYSAMEAKIYRSAHHLEKGMSLSRPKEAFGVEKAKELFAYLKEYISMGYDIQGEAYNNAKGVLAGYLSYHHKKGFEMKELNDEYAALFGMEFYNSPQVFGTETIKFESLASNWSEGYGEFVKSRHSVRQFTDTCVSEETIREAVSIAKHAPSACNRQSVKVYYYRDGNINKRIGDFIGGNKGFDDEVKNYLVITSSVASFGNPNERNQMYLDAGLFAMSLIESLHSLGIASCILQNGENRKRDKIIRGICTNIPKWERIILFIAIGHYKENVIYASSHRKETDHVLEIL